MNSIEFIEDRCMERTKFTGKYVLPDGTVVQPEDIVIHTKFITYGPEDLSGLLYAGVIAEETELVYVIITDDALNKFNPMTFTTVPQPPKFDPKAELKFLANMDFGLGGW